ncbi:MAG TPA: class I adenylate-forming enzyme family protein [Acidimicrobiia bacterium]|nr:class I adenylate-forming enzyme family protein [Acidimicrobiia bacterium]
MTMSIQEATEMLTAPGQMFEMETIEIRGVPTRVWKNTPASLRDVLELSRGHGDADFLVYEDDRISFEEHFRQAAHLARVLVERFGVEKGDRVAIVMRNFPEWVAAFWAAAAAGAVVVPLNAWWAADELQFGLDDSGTTVVFADEERMERLREVDLKTGDRTLIVVRAEGEPDAGWLRYEDVVGDVPTDAALPDVEIDPEDDATIFYTSGTTGRPKGALGTHRNICTNLMSLFFVSSRQSARGGGALIDEGGEDQERPPTQNAYLLSVPLFHATGCHSVLVSNTAAGGKLVMMHKWDATRALELIERERVTIFGGVPAMAWQVVEHPDFDRYDTSSVRSVSYGGAPAAPELVRLIRERFPKVSPGNGYGLTETSSVTSMNTGDDYVRKPESVGPAVPVCDVKVVGADGETLPIGEVGELWIKGPNVVKGYWNRPDATAETITDGWLHTGDVARLDEEGFIYIVDRAKDMVIRGGENVYCVEVESVLYEHPAVSDAAVFGVPHKVLGEEVGAAVQVTGDVTVEELQEWVRARLADFKVPRYIDLRPEPLPRNPQGKILKRELREELAPRWAG